MSKLKLSWSKKEEMIKVNLFKLGSLVLIISFCFLSCNGQDKGLLLREEIIEPKEFKQTQKADNSRIAKHIHDIFEDSQGNLWLGTSDLGVIKYDGTRLQYISEKEGLCGKTVANIAEDKNGNIWLGTHHDMCILHPSISGQEGKVSLSYFEKNGEVPHLGYGWKKVQTDKNGDIWINSHHGIFKYLNGEFVEFTFPDSIHPTGHSCATTGAISLDLEDSHGNFWFGTDGDGVYRFDGSQFSHFNMNDGLINNNISSIVEDQNGVIWISCFKSVNDSEDPDGGIVSYDGKLFKQYENIEGLYNNSIHRILNDNSGNIWIGATGTGVYKHDGEKFKLYEEPKEMDCSDGFNICGLESLLEDQNGQIWMGISGGLFQLKQDKIVHMGLNDLNTSK